MAALAHPRQRGVDVLPPSWDPGISSTGIQAAALLGMLVGCPGTLLACTGILLVLRGT